MNHPTIAIASFRDRRNESTSSLALLVVGRALRSRLVSAAAVPRPLCASSGARRKPRERLDVGGIAIAEGPHDLVRSSLRHAGPSNLATAPTRHARHPARTAQTLSIRQDARATLARQLDRRLQRRRVVAPRVPPSVDEDGRSAVDAAPDPAFKMLLHAPGIPVAGFEVARIAP